MFELKNRLIKEGKSINITGDTFQNLFSKWLGNYLACQVKIYTTHLIDLQIVPELSIVVRNRQLCQLQDEEEQ